MSFSTALRRQTQLWNTAKRHASSKATKATRVKSHRTLPDAKMRALIALYHQADTFITPEDLSRRIDEAFVPDKQIEDRTWVGPKSINIKDLENTLDARKNAPKTSEWENDTLSDFRTHLNVHWSSLKTARELRVVEALYGVNATQVGAVLPGLEVLEEAVEAEMIPEAMDEGSMKEYLGTKL